MSAHTPAPPDHAPPSSPVDGGLVGIASTLPVSGRPTIEALSRLRWRGNGRSGGVAVAGCFSAGLADAYALNIALSARHLRAEIEREFIAPHFDIVEAEFQPDLGDFRALAGLPSRPPVVVRYFVRALPGALAEFAAQQGLAALDRAEDEFVYWSATRINRALYTGHPERRAFVLSYGRDLMILRAAGYAEDVARYYRLDEMPAHVWLGHQSYATRTEPAGANPFPAVDAAAALSGGLVNYDALATYVRQRGYLPLFRSDVELTAALFDFYRRACAYPLDLALEALYPTPRDGLDGAPPARREAYRAVRRTHVHGALAGRVAFAVARACREARGWELIAAIDSERQHAHAFGLQEGTLWGGERYGVGVVASELQAVEAVFAAIAEEQSAVCPIPDKTWSAGSLDGESAGGAAYSFTVAPEEDGGLRLWCADRYGRAITTDRARMHRDPRYASAAPSELDPSPAEVAAALRADDVDSAYARARAAVREWGFILLGSWLDGVVTLAALDPALRWPAIQLLTWLHDRPIDIGVKKRSAVLAMLRRGLGALFNAPAADVGESDPGDLDRRLTWVTLATRGAPTPTSGRLYIDAANLPPDGGDSVAQVLIRVCRAGWRNIVIFGCKGDRFVGSGLGSDGSGLRVDVYGTPGDYLAAGLDGAEVHVHGAAQDMVGYMMAGGTLVVYGDVGQAFLHGASGGEAFLLGAPGARACLNAGGTLRVATRAGAEVLDFAHPDAGPDDIQAMQRKAAAFFGRPAGEDAG